jgi:hypothetical protein
LSINISLPINKIYQEVGDMARAILLDDKAKAPCLNELLIQVLIDTAKKEIGKGIDRNFLADVYRKTYGKSVAKKIFKIVKQLNIE